MNNYRAKIEFESNLYDEVHDALFIDMATYYVSHKTEHAYNHIPATGTQHRQFTALLTVVGASLRFTDRPVFEQALYKRFPNFATKGKLKGMWSRC